MKKLANALVLGAALWSTGVAADILIVDNRPNAPTGAHVYSTIQAAHDAANGAGGDILHVIASPKIYAVVAAEISKPLAIYGIGYTQDNDFPTIHSVVGRIDLNTGAEGTILEGLYITDQVRFDTAVSSIAIRKCRFSGSIEEDGVNKGDITISDCVFNRPNGRAIELNSNIVGPIVIRNNIFVYSYIQLASALITNNVFVAATNNSIGSVHTTSGCTIQNNIFYRLNPLHWGNGVAVSVTSNIYNNNILFDSLDDTIPNGTVVESNTGSGNLLATDPLFVNFPAGGSNSWFITWDFNLQISPTTSPAIGAGTDGTNIGITGGPAPYDPTVGLPLIESIDTAGSVKKGTDLSVSIEAQAN